MSPVTLVWKYIKSSVWLVYTQLIAIIDYPLPILQKPDQRFRDGQPHHPSKPYQADDMEAAPRDVDIVFGGSGLKKVWYQMGVANAIRTQLDEKQLAGASISGLSGGVIAALGILAHPATQVSSAHFQDWVQDLSAQAISGGILNLAKGVHDVIMHTWLPSLSPATRKRITEQAGVYVHNVSTGNIVSLQHLHSDQELAAAAAASCTALFATSLHTHVDLGFKANDPAIYSEATIHKAFAETGRKVIYLPMETPSPVDSGAIPALPGSGVDTIHCINPVDSRWNWGLAMPTLAHKRQDYYAGEAWGTAYVVPRLKALLTDLGVAQ
jgi:hypothetical protein